MIDARSRAKVSSENRYDVTNIPPAARLPVRQSEQLQRSAESICPEPDPQANQGGRKVGQHSTKQQTELEKEDLVIAECVEAIEECNDKFIQTFMYDLMSYQQATEFLLDYEADKDFLVGTVTVNDTFFFYLSSRTMK